MKIKPSQFLYIFFALLLVIIATPNTIRDFIIDAISLRVNAAPYSSIQPNNSFKVFDGTLFTQKPKALPPDFEPLKVIYEAEMWGPKKNYPQLPERILIKRAADHASKAPWVVIDIEHWQLINKNHQINADSLSKYLQVLSWYREFQPTLKLGYYGHPPISDYWRAIDVSANNKNREWKLENDAIAPLADAVDVFYPSLYTFYTDRAGWVNYAKAQIEEARRLANGKPVFAFLWPQYHNSNRLLGCQFLPNDFWQLQLETVSQLADGVVIWGGWDVCNKNGKALPWNDNAEWWQVTKKFMEKINP